MELKNNHKEYILKMEEISNEITKRSREKHKEYLRNLEK